MVKPAEIANMMMAVPAMASAPNAEATIKPSGMKATLLGSVMPMAPRITKGAITSGTAMASLFFAA